MLCPICKGELITTGYAKLETLSEHVMGTEVSMKPKFVCKNPNCIGQQDKLVWEEFGEYFGAEKKENWFKKYPFIDNNNAPFGTLNRAINVEVYKHDEDWTLANFYFIKFIVTYSYNADKNGDILKRKRRVVTWIRNGDTTWTHYISGWHMLIYSLKRGIAMHELYKNYPININELRSRLEYKKWDKRWWYLLSTWLLRLMYGRGVIR